LTMDPKGIYWEPSDVAYKLVSAMPTDHQAEDVVAALVAFGFLCSYIQLQSDVST
jgi:hypothetical protein